MQWAQIMSNFCFIYHTNYFRTFYLDTRITIATVMLCQVNSVIAKWYIVAMRDLIKQKLRI